jgi:hypothetical protein
MTKRQICDPITLGRASAIVAATLILCPGILLGKGGKTPKRQASILLSNGKVYEGTVLLTPGVDFRLVGIPSEEGTKFGRVLSFNLNIVKEMTFSPYREFYRKHFRFERGTATKIYEGDPYPILEPKCTVLFNSGQKRSGILHSTVIYLKEKDPDTGITLRNRKYILKSKQKGKPGQKFSDLVYVTRIRMLDEGDKIARSLDVKLLSLDPKSAGDLKAMTQDTLTSVPVKTEGDDGNTKVYSTFGENVFLATRIGDRYVAGWPEEGTKRTKLFKSVESEFLKFVDYYNERKLLGILPLEGGRKILTLARLRRQAPDGAYRGMPGFFEIDGNGELMEFFRLSVWMWRRDPETGNMVLVDRGSFYRFRIDAEAKTPEAGVCPDLWPVVKKDGKLLVGKAKTVVDQTKKPVEKAKKVKK